MVPRIQPSPSRPSQPPITHRLRKITLALRLSKLSLCFDNDINCSPRNPFSLITIQNALPYTPASPKNHHPKNFSLCPKSFLTPTPKTLYSSKAVRLPTPGSGKSIPLTSSTGILACERLMLHPGAPRSHPGVPLRPAPRAATIASRTSPCFGSCAWDAVWKFNAPAGLETSPGQLVSNSVAPLFSQARPETPQGPPAER